MKKKIQEEDLKTWNKFISELKNIEDKDKLINENNRSNIILSLDLHGLSLQEANTKVLNFIEKSHKDGFTKLKIITGKGHRSKKYADPYSSSTLSILKNSVPEFIKKNEIFKKIKSMKQAEIKDGGSGALLIFLKKNIKE